MEPLDKVVAVPDVEAARCLGLQDVHKKNPSGVTGGVFKSGGGKEIRTPGLPESFRDALARDLRKASDQDISGRSASADTVSFSCA